LHKPLIGKFGVGFSMRGQFVLLGIIHNRPRIATIPKPFFRRLFGHIPDASGYHIETIEEMEFDMSQAMLGLPIIRM